MKKKFLLLTVLASYFTLSANVMWTALTAQYLKPFIILLNLLIEWSIFTYFIKKWQRALFVVLVMNGATFIFGSLLHLFSDVILFSKLRSIMIPHNSIAVWGLVIECSIAIFINTLIEAPIALKLFPRIGTKKILWLVLFANILSNISIYVVSFYK